MKDLVIIGSGPAGLSASVYARRASMDVLVIEKEAYSGGQIVNTEKVDNYLGMPGISGYNIAMEYRKHADSQGVVFLQAAVTGIEDKGDYKIIELGDGSQVETRCVLIATGARHRLLGVKGETEFSGMGVSYCATCDGAFFKNKEVAVVGGGYVALQDALYLSKLCSKVCLIHRRDKFRVSKGLAQKVLSTENIEFLPFCEIEEISGEPGNLLLSVKNNQNHDAFQMNAAGVFVAVGMQPVTDFVEGVVALDDFGYVVAGEDTRTNVPGIFAAGDVRTKPLRQVATAVGDGATAIFAVEAYLNE